MNYGALQLWSPYGAIKDKNKHIIEYQKTWQNTRQDQLNWRRLRINHSIYTAWTCYFKRKKTPKLKHQVFMCSKQITSNSWIGTGHVHTAYMDSHRDNSNVMNWHRACTQHTWIIIVTKLMWWDVQCGMLC